MIKAVFPGTFDPIHNGHIDIALRAEKIVDELVIAVYDRPIKNALFSPEERLQLVKDVFKEKPSIQVIGYSGLTVQLCRDLKAQAMIRGLRVISDFEYEFRMALANHHLAPDIEVIALITSEEHTFLSSSTVREISTLGGDVSSMVPTNVKLALDRKITEMDGLTSFNSVSPARD